MPAVNDALLSTRTLAAFPGHLGVQGIHTLLPTGPVPAQPFIDLGERLRTKTIDPPLRLPADPTSPPPAAPTGCCDPPG